MPAWRVVYLFTIPMFAMHFFAQQSVFVHYAAFKGVWFYVNLGKVQAFA